MMSDKIRILYIDDYELDRELVKDALEKEHGGFEVTEASDKQEFEALLKTREFDVVLSDFNIAGFEGLQVLEAVQEYDPNIPVIIVTGTGSEEIAVRALKQGASDYVIKRPKHIRKLPQTILAAIEKQTLKDQRRKAQTALKDSDERYRKILENVLVGVYQVTLDGKFIFANQKMTEMFGYSSYEELEAIDSIAELYARSEERQKVVDEIISKGFIIGEREFRRKDGHSIWVKLQTRKTTNNEGAIILEGLMEDVTEFKKLERQLLQAQKMEAIGTLAGGVAHDFNNILTSIIGNAELMLMTVDKDGPLREEIEEIKIAGERAAALTRQLLAFSRKQIVQPEILDLNELLTDIEKMVVRLIGEDVEIRMIPESALWRIEIDPGQMEQVIINLAVNARDAMPTGGKLTIETANMDLDENYFAEHGIVEERPGPYVMMAVSDTGSGMDKEVQEHIFDPFYTTKEKGKGTGLGLSTIYGIVKQNNGFIWVYSEPGQGSTFEVYLPKVKGDVKAEEKGQTPVENLDGFETVLIVEDNDSLRKLARTVLKQNGYKVLAAENGEDALRISMGNKGPIDLIVTDVVMPKMSGRETVERLQPLYPKMKVIYMSGYTDNSIVHHGVLTPGLNFLEKPFSPEGLARKVREVLDKQIDD
jgi:two-component system cell cycle sensor histidine kinase/response regulator CckA